MKSKYLAVLATVALLSSCGGQSNQETTTTTAGDNPTTTEPTTTPKPSLNLKDSRSELYTAVFGEIVNGNFDSYNKDQNYKSLYEAIEDIFFNGEYGSYLYKIGDATKTPIYVKRASFSDDTSNKSPLDQWFWYQQGGILDGYAGYLLGYTDFNINKDITAVYSTTDNLKPSYQPYGLVGTPDGHAGTTPAWNLEPYLDANVIYNPLSFSGIQTTTYTFKLTDAKIRPSYNAKQKVEPKIYLSTVDGYNSSKQGLYMDDTNGNWYYFNGESQSETKLFDYSDKELILTSTWNEDTQEFTPNGDVTFNLKTNYDEELEVLNNTLDIKVTTGEGSKEFHKIYEYSSMTECGTHRAAISLDLIPTSKTDPEDMTLPDFDCGAYMNNIVVTEAKGTVAADLDEVKYTQPIGLQAGTYDLLNSSAANPAKKETILHSKAHITYDFTNSKDVFNLSYVPVSKTETRSEEILAAKAKVEKIKEGDTKESASVIVAKKAFDSLSKQQQLVLRAIDKVTAIYDEIFK